jgi:hypothetical protein
MEAQHIRIGKKLEPLRRFVQPTKEEREENKKISAKEFVQKYGKLINSLYDEMKDLSTDEQELKKLDLKWDPKQIEYMELMKEKRKARLLANQWSMKKEQEEKIEKEKKKQMLLKEIQLKLAEKRKNNNNNNENENNNNNKKK